MWEINQELFNLFYQFAHRSPVIDGMIIFCASILPFIAVFIAVIHALRIHDIKKELRQLFWLFGPAFVAYLFSVVIKLLMEFPRPFAYARDIAPLITVNDPFGTFPSSHTIFFSTLGFAMYMHDHRFGAAYIFIAVIIGVARIMAGVHWPFDVLSGFLLGQLIALIAYDLESRVINRKNKPVQ
jgi:membrane-associated phospholipid phosphatase